MNTTMHTEILFQAYYHPFSQGEILDDFNEIVFTTPLDIFKLKKLLGKKIIGRITYSEK